MDKYIVLSRFPAKNGRDTLARVRSQDPTEKSFLVIVARFAEDKLNQIHEGTIVLLRKLENLNLLAIVDVLGVMPMPLQLDGFREEMEWQHPDDLLAQKQVVEILEVMQAQMLRVMSLLR